MTIAAIDLTEAMARAVELSQAVEQPTVVAGALAMAAHGHRRETSDVDIVLPVIIGKPSGDVLESAARDLEFTVRAKHGFGGLDLRAGDVRIDVFTLDHDVPTLVPDAIKEAVASGRKAALFGQSVFFVSLGHLIAMKLVAEHRKDIVDIVELIKVRLEAGKWSDDRSQVLEVVREHLGWYAARTVDTLAATARSEVGLER